MKIYLFLILIVLNITALVYAQKPAKTPISKADPFILKKQIFVDDIESQLNQVQYASVRVYVRYELARWLWIIGRDKTDRAEALAVKAVDELYDKATEIPEEGPDLKKDLFRLLETNAKPTADKLRAKYNYNDDITDLFSIEMFDMERKDRDKFIAEKILRVLAKGGDFDDTSITMLLVQLRGMKSPQYLVVLTAILDADEQGRIATRSDPLSLDSDDLVDQIVTVALRRRYFNLLLTRARNALQGTEEEIAPYPDLLTSAIRDLGESVPDLVPEAEALREVLDAKRSALERSLAEANARIEASSDKLAATIEEAEKAGRPEIKRSFYSRAVGLAAGADKFGVAIALVEKVRELNKKDELWPDMLLTDISVRALRKDDPVSAKNAIKAIRGSVKQAEAWKNAAFYFAEKNDIVEAQEAIGKAIKILSETSKDDPKRARELLLLIAVVMSVDKARLPEVIVITAKAINDFPTPGADDKPGTKNYEKYVAFIVNTNSRLTAVMQSMYRVNKTDAQDLAERIQKREVRIVADMLIGIDALMTAQVEAAKKKRAIAK